mgnify:CR=1 FL=1
MNGLHLTADLRDCAAPRNALTDVDALRAACLAAVEAVGLTPVGTLFHHFGGDGGATGVVLLAESHLAVHTWPELDAVTLDVYVCNFGVDNTPRAHALMDRLLAHFAPAQANRHALHRGQPPRPQRVPGAAIATALAPATPVATAATATATATATTHGAAA